MAIEFDGQQALRIWYRALIGSVRDDIPDLSARQMAILLTVFMEPPPHTVRGLASHLNVTKPVITRAVKTLCSHGLVKKKTDEADRRNVFIQRTMKGATYLIAFSDLIIESGKAE